MDDVDHFFKLSKHKISVAYGICFDNDGSIWIAAKCGVYKFNAAGDTCLLRLPKDETFNLIGAFTGVQNVKERSQILMHANDWKSGTSVIKIIDYDGNTVHAINIQGKVHSCCMTAEGRIFYCKHPRDDADSSTLFSFAVTDMQHNHEPTATFANLGDFAFQFLTYIEDSNVIAATAVKKPVTPASQTKLVMVDGSSGEIVETYMDIGKPQAIQAHGKGVILMDKNGSFLQYPEKVLLHKMPAYLANGFTGTTDHQGATLVTCSGFVNEDNQTVMDDWVTKINLCH